MRKALTVFFLLAVMVSASYAADYVPGDVIVVLRNDSGVSIGSVASSSGGVKALSSVQSFAQSSNVSVKKTFDALSDLSNSIFMVVHSDNEDAKSLLRKISSNPNVLAASLNTIYHIEAVSKDLGTVPEDKEYHRLWGMEAINAPYAWNYSKGSDNVYVAVVDSGIDYEHPDLADNFAAEYSMNFVSGTNYTEASYYDENNHGTHVAGTIGAVGDNGIGVAGVNWNVKLISVRVIGADGRGNGQTLLAGMNYVASLLKTYPEMKLAAMNYSIGGGWFYTPEEIITENHPQYLALKAISDTNRTVICVAAGNSSTEVGAPVFYANFNTIAQGTYAYPASFRGIDNMIVVAAAKSDMTRASFSNYSGKYVDIAAPGQGIYSTVAQDNTIDLTYDKVKRNYPYALMSGTSMAAPHVSGAAALLKSLYPNATASQIKASIVGGANSAVLRDDGTSMYGMLDIKGAMDYMNRRLYESAAPEISDANPPEGIVNQPYNFKFYASGSEPITWTLDGELPEGLSFDNGVITGTPSAEGSKTFFVTAENEYGSDSGAYTINISGGVRPVIIHDVDIQPVHVGSSWDMYLQLSQGTYPFTWEITNSADIISDGSAISIDKSSGYIEFIPQTLKTYKITVKVSNSQGQDSINLNVPSTYGGIPEIEDKTLKNAITGRIYGISLPSDFPASHDISANSMKYGDTIAIDSISDYTYSIISPSDFWRITPGTRIRNITTGEYMVFGILPPGIEAEKNSDGLYLRGTPTTTGEYLFAVEVTNSIGTVSRDFTITVENAAPSFLADTYELTYAKGVHMDLRIPVLGTPDVSFRSAGAFPENVSFTEEDLTAVFTGSPTKTGMYSAVLTASNVYGTANANVIITIAEPAVITTSTIPYAVKGEVYSFNFSSLNDVELSWSIDGNALSDTGLIMSSSGEFFGIPTKAGDYRFTVTASAIDGSGLSDSKTYLLRILDKAAITNTWTLHSGVINTVYEPVQLEYSGTSPVHWTITEGNLPAGLDMTTNGCIHGTPTEAGTFTFTAKAANTAGYNTKTFTLSITDGTIPVLPESHDTPVNPPEASSPDKPVEPKIMQGEPRRFSSLKDSERETLSQEKGYIVAILPEISVDISGVYTFEEVTSFANINSSPDVPAGATLVWHPFPQNTSADSESSSAAFDAKIFADESTSQTTNSTATFYNSEGSVINTVPEDGVLNVSAYLEAGVTYAPVISAVSSTASSDTTSSDTTSSDVTDSDTTSSDVTDSDTTSSDVTDSKTISSDVTDTDTASSDKTVTPTTPVKPTITMGNSRTASSLMLNERAVIAQENGLIAAMLPEISVNVSGIYTYEKADALANVELASNIPVGYTLVWHPFVHTSLGTSSIIEASDSDTDSATFYDTEGNVIYTVPSNRKVNISAYLESGKIYAPVVAAVAGGENSGAHSSGGGGGGCENGLSVLALLLCAVIFRKNSR